MRVLEWILLVALGFLVITWGAIPLGSLDLFWQVRAGELALEAGTFPRVDSFSYVIGGLRWNNHEWLFELVVAALHRAFGWGWFRLQALLPALVLVGLWWRVRQIAGGATAILVATGAFLLFTNKFLPLPQTLSMALFFLGAELFLRRRWLRSVRWRVALVVFMLVWGNLTAEALIFLPFLLAVQGRAIWRQRSKRGELALSIGWLLAACLLPLVNPPWASSLEYLLHGTAVNVELNSEFTSIFAPAATVSPLVKWFARVWCVALVVWLVRKRSLPVLLAVIGACLFERNLWLLAFPIISVVITTRRVSRFALPAAAVLLVAWTVESGWVPMIGRPLLTASWWTEHLDARFVPIACAERLASEGPVKVFTTRLWASYLIWRAPNARVFVDGRNREYPPWATHAAEEIARAGPAAKWMLEESGTDRVLLPPGWSVPGWNSEFSAPGCAVYSR